MTVCIVARHLDLMDVEKETHIDCLWPLFQGYTVVIKISSKNIRYNEPAPTYVCNALKLEEWLHYHILLEKKCWSDKKYSWHCKSLA